MDRGAVVHLDYVWRPAGTPAHIGWPSSRRGGGGATVYVEDPTYVKSLQVFQSAHLRLCGLTMDDQGLSLEALEKHLRQSSDRGNSVLYTIPTNHNPTGRTLSRRRRIQLLELCNRYDLPIIEDGAYEELTFDGTPPHPVSAPVLCLYDAGRIPPGCQSAGCGCPFAGRMKDTVKPSYVYEARWPWGMISGAFFVLSPGRTRPRS